MILRVPSLVRLVLLFVPCLFEVAHSLSAAGISQPVERAQPAQKTGLYAQTSLRHTKDGSSAKQSRDWSNNGQVRKVDMWPGVIMASIAGASTLLGATVILFMPEGGPPPSAMAFSFSLAAGVMIAISVEMLMPHEHHGHSTFSWTPVFIFSAGVAGCALLCKLADCFESTAAAKQDEAVSKSELDERKSFRLAALLFVSLTLHNFPEGFAVAVSALSGLRLGLMMCIAVAAHNIPEGIALAVSVYAATKSYGQSFFWTFLSGLTEPLGAICAMMLIQAYLLSTPDLLVHLLTAVAGIMCYVALAELLPEAVSTRCWLSIVLGFAAGILIMVLTHWVIESSIDSGHIDVHF
jgi:ZIP family zinc transporter